MRLQGTWTNGQTEGRMDGCHGRTDRVIPIYPPNFVGGGIIKKIVGKRYIDTVNTLTYI